MIYEFGCIFTNTQLEVVYLVSTHLSNFTFSVLYIYKFLYAS